MRSAPIRLLTVVLLFGIAADAFARPDDEVAAALQTIESTRRAGDVAGAAAAASALVEKHPSSVEAHIAHQDLQIACGREKAVLASYRGAAAAPDASADAHFLCGRLLRGGGAVSEFRAALKADPEHFWAACGLGIELTRAKTWAEAQTTLEDAARRRPASAVPVNALGRLAEARGRPEDAEKQYRAALALEPKLAVARVNLGMLLVGLGKQDTGMAQLKEAASDAPKDAMPQLAIAMACRAANDEKGALEALQRAATADASDVASLNVVAEEFLSLDKPDLAEAALQRALKTAPASVATNVNLAFVRVKREEYGEAVRFATAAVQADDECAEAHYVLAVAFERQYWPKKAEPEFRRAAELDRDNPDFARAWAAFAASNGDWSRAISEYSRAAKLSDAPNDVLMELAGAYCGAQKPANAAATYDQIVASDAKRLDALLELGIVCARDLKQTKRASKAFHAYVDRGGKDPRVPAWLAKLDAK